MITKTLTSLLFLSILLLSSSPAYSEWKPEGVPPSPYYGSKGEETPMFNRSHVEYKSYRDSYGSSSSNDYNSTDRWVGNGDRNYSNPNSYGNGYAK